MCASINWFLFLFCISFHVVLYVLDIIFYFPRITLPKMVNTLIDDCLIYILVRLPIWEFHHVELVSRRWNSLARIAATQRRCIKLTHRYTEMQHALYDGLGLPTLRGHHLIVGDLTNKQKTLELLVRKYPNIRSLEYRQYSTKRLDMLPYLVHSWPNLVTLKVFVGHAREWSVHSEWKNSSDQWNSLLELIASTLESLRRLVLCDYGQGSVHPRIRLPPNLARLESFHCGLLFKEANISIAQIRQWKRLRTFGFIYVVDNHKFVKEAYDQYSRLLVSKPTSPLTELMLNNPFDCAVLNDWTVLCKFYHNYQALTRVHLNILLPLHCVMFNSGLHQLNNLAYLNILCWHKSNLLPYGDEHVNLPWRTELCPTKPLYSSLRTLHLSFVPYYPLEWAVDVLPNLETVQMDRKMYCIRAFCRTQPVLDSLKLLTSLRQVIYLGKVYSTQPELNIQYVDAFPWKM